MIMGFTNILYIFLKNNYMINKHIQQIKEDGYTLIPNVYESKITTKLLEMCKEWYEKTQDEISKDVPFLNTNQVSLYNLQNKDIFFLEALFTSKDVEKILIHFLNDKWYKQIPQDQPNYILRSYGARSSNKGLPLHIDSFFPYKGEEVIAMQYAIVLEDQNFNNGCTTVVPGSHQSGKYASQEAAINAIAIESKAGDVVIWDSRLWHGTTDNISGKSRWAVVSTFTRWWIKQHFNITDNLPQHIYEKLSEKEKAILGFCSIPFNTEYEGIDFKRGHNQLFKDVIAYKS
jgi:ectoine hydroxylase-related dioxygenase (phytanoyl-CoA dioxygenase family)